MSKYTPPSSDIFILNIVDHYQTRRATLLKKGDFKKEFKLTLGYELKPSGFFYKHFSSEFNTTKVFSFKFGLR